MPRRSPGSSRITSTTSSRCRCLAGSTPDRGEYPPGVLQVRLLGELEVEADGRPVPAPAGGRAGDLFAWLALTPGEHPRSAVAARFWPDVLDASARASL